MLGHYQQISCPTLPDLAVPHTGQGTLRGPQAQRGAHRHSLSCFLPPVPSHTRCCRAVGLEFALVLPKANTLSRCLAGGWHILIPSFHSSPSTSSSPFSIPHQEKGSLPDSAAILSSFQKKNTKKGDLLSKHRNIYF